MSVVWPLMGMAQSLFAGRMRGPVRFRVDLFSSVRFTLIELKCDARLLIDRAPHGKPGDHFSQIRSGAASYDWAAYFLSASINFASRWIARV
jgi:hypothetical protein